MCFFLCIQDPTRSLPLRKLKVAALEGAEAYAQEKGVPTANKEKLVEGFEHAVSSQKKKGKKKVRGQRMVAFSYSYGCALSCFQGAICWGRELRKLVVGRKQYCTYCSLRRCCAAGSVQKKIRREHTVRCSSTVVV